MLSLLPRAVVALRMRIFAAVNGDEAIAVPGPLVDAAHFHDVYAHPAANGRSRGAALSDLFWYWLAPGPQVHQEHLEAGETYDDVARTTRHLLARPKAEIAELVGRCAARHLDAMARLDAYGMREVRLRDLMMPIWADVFYELVFAEPCPARARALIVDNATDVITALKCTGLRHMERRERLTAYLRDRLTVDEPAIPLPSTLTTEEQAWYVQGTFFNTAVVQMSEAMTHLLLAVAQHRDVHDRLAAALADEGSPAGRAYADRVIDEALRCYPLFGIAHRITTGEIAVDERTTLPAGSVLCFNYPAYHSIGFDDPERFDPDRWLRVSPRDAHHIPFGVTANRPCPARGIAPLAMRVAAREVLRRFVLYSTAAHTRSIPHRGPCLLVRRPSSCQRNVAREGEKPLTSVETRRLQRQRWRQGWALRRRLAWMRTRDRWEDVSRSVVQLVLGTWMVLEARRLRHTQRHFAMQTEPSYGRTTTKG
ncbi:MAG: cytochrome P450 [Actinopolymorphaceae bacterium]